MFTRRANLFVRHPSRFGHTRALVRDRASQFTGGFDEIFLSEGLKILRTPVRVPVANAFAERWIATLRRELLDRTIIWNQRQLQRLVIDYIDAQYTRRPHRSLDQRPPASPESSTASRQQPSSCSNGALLRSYQRIPNSRLTSRDAISGTHRM